MDFHNQSTDRRKIRARESFSFNAFNIADNHIGLDLIHGILKCIGINQNLF